MHLNIYKNWPALFHRNLYLRVLPHEHYLTAFVAISVLVSDAMRPVQSAGRHHYQCVYVACSCFGVCWCVSVCLCVSVCTPHRNTKDRLFSVWWPFKVTQRVYYTVCLSGVLLMGDDRRTAIKYKGILGISNFEKHWNVWSGLVGNLECPNYVCVMC